MRTIVAFDMEELKHKMRINNVDSLAEVENAGGRNIDIHTQEYILPNETGETVFRQVVQLDTPDVIHEEKLEHDNNGAYFTVEEEKCYRSDYVRNNYFTPGVGLID